MKDYFKNHQLYLAEKCDWLDRHVNKTSVRAIMKIVSYRLSEGKQRGLLMKLIDDSFFRFVDNTHILRKEGFFLQNLDN